MTIAELDHLLRHLRFEDTANVCPTSATGVISIRGDEYSGISLYGTEGRPSSFALFLYLDDIGRSAVEEPLRPVTPVRIRMGVHLAKAC